MKRTAQIQRIVNISLYFLVFFACRKSVTSPDPQPNGMVAPTDTTSTAQQVNETPVFPQSGTFQCNGPDYGDSVIYPQPVGPLQSYSVSPVNNPGAGHYFSWPAGLSINSSNGTINVTQSATGQRYVIGFVKNGTQDTCLTPIIIGGAAYADSIYVLENDAKKAAPYFNANPNIASICTGSGTGGQKCAWDIYGMSALQQIQIDKNTGEIDLENTLSKAFPLKINGASVETTIYYQLNDASNMAVQQTPVKFIYYNKRSDIPQALLDQIANKRSNILNDILILLGGNPRPPIIIITRYN